VHQSWFSISLEVTHNSQSFITVAMVRIGVQKFVLVLLTCSIGTRSSFPVGLWQDAAPGWLHRRNGMQPLLVDFFLSLIQLKLHLLCRVHRLSNETMISTFIVSIFTVLAMEVHV